MKTKKIFRTLLPCLLLGGTLCSCRPHYYLPGGNHRRKPAQNCGCPSFSQHTPLIPGTPEFQPLHGNQPVYAHFLPVGDVPHADERR